MGICGRTDLASEALRLQLEQAEALTELPGIRAKEEKLFGCGVTAVEILDERGEAALGKPLGRYYTLRLPVEWTRDCLQRGAQALAALLGRCLPGEAAGPVLLAALGNPDITPDAVGPLTGERLLVTRHLKEQAGGLFSAFRPTALVKPGVLGSSGMESAEQLGALCRQLQPAFVLAIDALAGTELDALCHCIQICNTGIAPGSGVGNNRKALTRESLGVPVLAVGVPTVIDAGSLCREAGLAAMFVTPRDIDEAVRRVSRILAYGINLALHPSLRLEELEEFFL